MSKQHWALVPSIFAPWTLAVHFSIGPTVCDVCCLVPGFSDAWRSYFCVKEAEWGMMALVACSAPWFSELCLSAWTMHSVPRWFRQFLVIYRCLDMEGWGSTLRKGEGVTSMPHEKEHCPRPSPALHACPFPLRLLTPVLMSQGCNRGSYLNPSPMNSQSPAGGTAQAVTVVTGPVPPSPFTVAVGMGGYTAAVECPLLVAECQGRRAIVNHGWLTTSRHQRPTDARYQPTRNGWSPLCTSFPGQANRNSS